MVEFHISLQARNGGLRYKDASGTYRFNLSREGKTWVVHLPPSKEKDMEFLLHYLSAEERELLYPRKKAYLSRICWLSS